MQNELRKVYALYRVSTLGQVDHDDLPVQRKACHSFVANKPGWQIIREEKELGISGSKVSASKRDIIQDYLEDAKQGKFDVLLVFMFDRLGRIEDETPFVLEAFVKSGVECWSVCEGQQKIENHTDKLMNYIRFWQAAGESHKMAQRIGETHSQIIESGHFRGGYVPFGYKSVDKGRKNKKDIALLDLEIDPTKSIFVEEIFCKTINEGMGSHTLAGYLNSKGVLHNTGSKFNRHTIWRILKNPIYTGYLMTSKTTSPHLPNLQIIPQNIFDKAQIIVGQRILKNEKKIDTANKTKNAVLLLGTVFCGHCGTRLSSLNHTDRRKRRDGTIYRREQVKYQCYHKTQGKTDCDGQHHYIAQKVDDVILRIAKDIMRKFSKTTKDESIEWRASKHIFELQKVEKSLLQKIKKQAQQLEKLNSEVALCLMGESKFSEQTLISAISAVTEEIQLAKQEQNTVCTKLQNQSKAKKGINKYYDEFESWCGEFDKASHERKRMILCEMFDRIELRKGYGIAVYVNKNYEQFLMSQEDKINCLNEEHSKIEKKNAQIEKTG